MSRLEWAAYDIGERREPFFADVSEPIDDEENIAKLEATRADLRKT
jgi:hypothetical protein